MHPLSPSHPHNAPEIPFSTFGFVCTLFFLVELLLYFKRQNWNRMNMWTCKSVRSWMHAASIYRFTLHFGIATMHSWVLLRHGKCTLRNVQFALESRGKFGWTSEHQDSTLTKPMEMQRKEEHESTKWWISIGQWRLCRCLYSSRRSESRLVRPFGFCSLFLQHSFSRFTDENECW